MAAEFFGTLAGVILGLAVAVAGGGIMIRKKNESEQRREKRKSLISALTMLKRLNSRIRYDQPGVYQKTLRHLQEYQTSFSRTQEAVFHMIPVDSPVFKQLSDCESCLQEIESVLEAAVEHPEQVREEEVFDTVHPRKKLLNETVQLMKELVEELDREHRFFPSRPS